MRHASGGRGRSAVSTAHVSQIQITAPLCPDSGLPHHPARRVGAGGCRRDPAPARRRRAAVCRAPGEFTALRSQLAKQARSAGDVDLAKAVTALRKPTVAAWALNHFVREHGDELDDFRAFAELLREAQRTLDADQLRALGRERAKRVDAVAERVAEEARAAGQALGAGVAQEVRDSLTALVADETAEASILTGALVRALVLLGVRLRRHRGGRRHRRRASSTARPGPARRSRCSRAAGEGGESAEASATVDLEERRRARRAAERTRLTAELEQARAALRTADRQVAVLTARQEEVVEGIADLERRLATARARLEKVTSELDEASGIRDEAESREAKAAEALAN